MDASSIDDLIGALDVPDGRGVIRAGCASRSARGGRAS